jgi:PAS domain S-box-containing protein
MEQHEPLARLTLDTLPMSIAVLDGDGTILFTNPSWDEFGGQGGDTTAESTGTNYFAGIDMAADDTATTAVEGIRAVMDGERSLFTLEYPCETPDGSKWFLMRVVPLSTDGEEVVVAHSDITERQRLEHLISRVNGLVRDVMGVLMSAETTDDVRDAVCEQFVAAEPYVRAWIADVDLRTGELVSVAGDPDPSTEIRIDREAGADPVAEAVETHELQVVATMDELPDASVHREYCPEAEAMAALPLVADDSLYGVLVVYADELDAFDERETVILEALGRTIATAINAIERKRLLTADTIVEVELDITDRGQFVFDLSRDLECELAYSGAVPQGDSSYLMFFTARGCDTQALLERAAADPDIVGAAHVSDFETGSFFEFEVTDPPIVSTLAAHGGQTRSITVTNGVARVEAELAGDANVRALVDALSETFESVEIVAYRERERPTQTREEFVSQLMSELTDRQRTALQKAFAGGFFEWPRVTSGEDLATSMDISPSTYHQHLRAAQRKLVTQIFEQ